MFVTRHAANHSVLCMNGNFDPTVFEVLQSLSYTLTKNAQDAASIGADSAVSRRQLDHDPRIWLTPASLRLRARVLHTTTSFFRLGFALCSRWPLIRLNGMAR